MTDPRRTLARISAVLLLAVALAGCTADRSYVPPTFPFHDRYASRAAAAPVLVQNTAWWERLKDPVLNRLIATALAGSPDLALARERVFEAKANVRTVSTTASLEPELRIERQRELGGPDQTIGAASAGFAWLFDPWGARRAQQRGATARVEAADAELDAARLLLIRSISEAYVELRYQQQLLAVRQRELSGRRQTLGLVRRLQESDSTTRLELVAAQARLAETEATLPRLQAAILIQKYRIAVLSGRSPGSLEVNLDLGPGQPRPRLAPDVGIPADLLRNRPDLKIGERLYYAALADIGAARADLYPKLSLVGTVTISAIDVSGSSYGVGPRLQLPALPGSPRRATVEARESRAQQALISWNSAVLDALLEVETALVDYTGAINSVSGSEKSVRLYRESVELTRNLVAGQGATLRDLVDAEVAVSDAEFAHAANLRQLALAFVALNISLGSGSTASKAAGG